MHTAGLPLPRLTDALLAVMYAAGAEAAAELWSVHRETVTELNELAGRLAASMAGRLRASQPGLMCFKGYQANTRRQGGCKRDPRPRRVR